MTAHEQMEAQHSLWSKGRTSAARYLDAVEQFTRATATSRRELSAYDLAVSAVNDCEGILLDQYEIIVHEPANQHATYGTIRVNPRGIPINLTEEAVQ